MKAGMEKKNAELAIRCLIGIDSISAGVGTLNVASATLMWGAHGAGPLTALSAKHSTKPDADAGQQRRT